MAHTCYCTRWMDHHNSYLDKLCHRCYFARLGTSFGYIFGNCYCQQRYIQRRMSGKQSLYWIHHASILVELIGSWCRVVHYKKHIQWHIRYT